MGVCMYSCAYAVSMMLQLLVLYLSVTPIPPYLPTCTNTSDREYLSLRMNLRGFRMKPTSRSSIIRSTYIINIIIRSTYIIGFTNIIRSSIINRSTSIINRSINIIHRSINIIHRSINIISSASMALISQSAGHLTPFSRAFGRCSSFSSAICSKAEGKRFYPGRR